MHLGFWMEMQKAKAKRTQTERHLGFSTETKTVMLKASETEKMMVKPTGYTA